MANAPGASVDIPDRTSRRTNPCECIDHTHVVNIESKGYSSLVHKMWHGIQNLKLVMPESHLSYVFCACATSRKQPND